MTPADYLREEFGEVGELIVSLNRLRVELTWAMEKVSDLLSEIASTQARLQKLQKLQETRESK